jgi:hypothetical protein
MTEHTAKTRRASGKNMRDKGAPTRKAPANRKKPKSQQTGAAKARTGTKQEKLVEMLRRPEGATIEQMAKALQWQT